MGNSILFTAFSIFTFLIVFGVLFQFMPIILGAVDNSLSLVISFGLISTDWLATYNELDDLKQLLIPLMMALGVALFSLKVLMIATNRSSD